MNNIQQITPMLHVPCIKEARYFFETLLGFSVSHEMDVYFYCDLQGSGIRVLEDDKLKPVPNESSKTTVYVDVQDVNELYATLQTALETLPNGYIVPPKNYSWKQREFHVRMPDGNFLAFGQPIE